MDELLQLRLGDKITVRTLPGRDGKPIGRLSDGCIILFNQDNPYFSMLSPGQSVECHVTVISEKIHHSEPHKRARAGGYRTL